MQISVSRVHRLFVPLDISVAEEQEEVVEPRKTEEEEMDREAPQQEEVEERPGEEEPVVRTEEGGVPDQEEDLPSGRSGF